MKARRALPPARVPAIDLTAAASSMALAGVVVILRGRSQTGAGMVLLAAVLGLFGADQLWTTAGCVLFSGSVLVLFSPAAGANTQEGSGRP